MALILRGSTVVREMRPCWMREVARGLRASATLGIPPTPGETLTPHRLGVFPLLGISLKTTGWLESIFSQVETRAGRVCNCANKKDMRRAVGAGVRRRLQSTNAEKRSGRERAAPRRGLEDEGKPCNPSVGLPTDWA